MIKQRKLLIHMTVFFTLLALLAALSQTNPTDAAHPVAPRINEADVLAMAAQGEVGPNDFQISQTGNPAGIIGGNPNVVYNTAAQEYFVVWHGVDETLNVDDGDTSVEIYGRRFNAQTGEPIGQPIPVSNMGEYDSGYTGAHPAVAYNNTDNEYLVVWRGDDNVDGLVDEEWEIFGQRLNGEGSPIGPNDFRISDMEIDGVTGLRVEHPDVVYNAARNEYLVAWEGREADNGWEIYIQQLDADGNEIGVNDFRISFMQPDSDLDYLARRPSIVYNNQNNEYLVIWRGWDTHEAGYREKEIYGQRLWYGPHNGATLLNLGPNFRISTSGPAGDDSYDVNFPAVAYNEATNQYLAAWTGIHGGGIRGINGRLIAADGEPLGNADFPISSEHDGSDGPKIGSTAVTYNRVTNEFLVVWKGVDGQSVAAEQEPEIFGQRLAANGTPVGAIEFQISDMGPDGAPDFDAAFPAVTSNEQSGDYLVVWQGVDDQYLLQEDEHNIFGQMLRGEDGAEIGANDFLASTLWQDLYYEARLPRVVYNSRAHEFLVAWVGLKNSPAEDEYFVSVQRVDAATGSRIGESKIISDQEPTNPIYQLSLAYNPDRSDYWVTWVQRDLATNNSGLYGQMLDGEGKELGSDDSVIVTQNVSGEALATTYNSVNQEYLLAWVRNMPGDYRIMASRIDGTTGAYAGGATVSENSTLSLAVAYNSQNNQYLVVWYKATENSGLEIFGQRLASASGNPIGETDFQISQMGPAGDNRFWGFYPDVVYNPDRNEYLVVWAGDDGREGHVDNEYEIFGQRLDAQSGTAVGQDDFRISDVGIPGDPSFYSNVPAVSYDGQKREYLVVWYGNHLPLSYEEFEIYGQLLDETGDEVGDDDFRLSDMGPDGDPSYFGTEPALAFAEANGRFLTVWRGNDDSGRLHPGEFEIFGQLFGDTTTQVYLPLVIK